MKYSKRLPLLALLFLLLFTLTGCKLTPEKALQKATAALAEQPLSKFSLDVNAAFSMEANGTSADTQLSFHSDTQVSSDPLQIYADVTMDIGGMAQNMELYGLVEDGTPTLYLYDVAADAWTRTPLEADITALAANPGSLLPADADPSIVTLTENVTLSDGTVAHQLSYTVSGSMVEDYEDAAAQLGQTFGLDKLDLSSLNLPMHVYLDPETFLPVQMELSVEGFDSVIEAILSAMLGDMASGVKFEIKELSFALSSPGFDQQAVPALPEDAPLRVDVLAHNPDMGDNTYVIRSIYDAVRVTCPDGWSVNSTGYYYVTFVRDDGNRVITFIAQEKESAKDSGLYTVSDVLARIQQAGEYHSDGRGEKLDDYELAWIRETSGIFYTYGWKHLSDNTLLLVEVLDGTGTYDAKALLSPATELVEAYPMP